MRRDRQIFLWTIKIARHIVGTEVLQSLCQRVPIIQEKHEYKLAILRARFLHPLWQTSRTGEFSKKIEEFDWFKEEVRACLAFARPGN
jgi:hypothetical protein